MRLPWSSSPRHRHHHRQQESKTPVGGVTALVATMGNADLDAGPVPDTTVDVAYRFRQAWMEGDKATAVPELLPVRLARACVAVLPVTGAGLSLIDEDFRVPIGASDDAAEAAERLQFTQGEGPCLDAARSGRVVIAEAEHIEQRWPAFGEQFSQQTPFRAVISIPLPMTADLRGALDLYLIPTDRVEAVSLAGVTIVSDQIVQALHVAQSLHASMNPQSEVQQPAWLGSPSAQNRTKVWVAMGMLMSRLHLPAADALARLRGYAYTHETDLDQLAAALMDGSLDLDRIDA
ncbi:MAG: hypothetical protein JWM76_4518 [Pseudonocardiales bacterium]|nr:hypothetical protein [Pseudonocardiales bacterium]